MIDERLVALVNFTKAKLATMKNARPSEIMAVKEDFAAAFLDVLSKGVGDIPDVVKIAAFDSMAKNHLNELMEEVKDRAAGNYCEDSDSEHYAWEAVRIAVIGPRAFDATNELEKILSRMKN